MQGILCPPWVDKGWALKHTNGLKKMFLTLSKELLQKLESPEIGNFQDFPKSLFSLQLNSVKGGGVTEITKEIPEKFFTSSTQWQQATQSSHLLKMSSTYKRTTGHTMIFALCYNYTSYKIICTAHNNSIFFESMPSNEVVKGNDVFNLPMWMIGSGGKIMKSMI